MTGEVLFRHPQSVLLRISLSDGSACPYCLLVAIAMRFPIRELGNDWFSPLPLFQFVYW